MTEERLGLLGGTFDPLHAAHLRIATAARDALRLDRVLFIPAGDPWRKRDRSITPAMQRLAMVRCALEGIKGFADSDLEVRRGGLTYTVDTLEALRAQGGDTLWFIMGSDTLEDLPNWREPQRLIGLTRLAVVMRPHHALSSERLDLLLPGLAAAVDWVPMEACDISAHAIRTRLAAGESVEDLVPPAVLAYIRAQGLYRSAG